MSNQSLNVAHVPLHILLQQCTKQGWTAELSRVSGLSRFRLSDLADDGQAEVEEDTRIRDFFQTKLLQKQEKIRAMAAPGGGSGAVTASPTLMLPAEAGLPNALINLGNEPTQDPIAEQAHPEPEPAEQIPPRRARTKASRASSSFDLNSFVPPPPPSRITRPPRT